MDVEFGLYVYISDFGMEFCDMLYILVD